MKVGAVAYEVGYQSEAVFSRPFKKITGVTRLLGFFAKQATVARQTAFRSYRAKPRATTSALGRFC